MISVLIYGSHMIIKSVIFPTNPSLRVEDHRSDREEANYIPESSPESPLELKEELPSYYPAIMGCRSVDEFECLNRLVKSLMDWEGYILCKVMQN